MDINAALYFNPRTKCYDVVPLREAHEKGSTVVVERLDTEIHHLLVTKKTENEKEAKVYIVPTTDSSEYINVVGVRLRDPEAAMAEYHMIKDDIFVYNEVGSIEDLRYVDKGLKAGPTEKVEASVSFVNEGPDQCCTEYPKCVHEFRKNKKEDLNEDSSQIYSYKNNDDKVIHIFNAGVNPDEERLKIINALTSSFDDGELTNKISDGSHTFEGLYHHRAVLTSLFANTVALKLDDLIDSMISRNHKENDENSALYITRAEATQGVRDRWDVWRSFLHEDGTMFDDYFIIGFTTQEGTFSYHYHKDYWDMFDGVREVAKAPAYDGHTEDDIMRLTLLLDLFK